MHELPLLAKVEHMMLFELQVRPLSPVEHRLCEYQGPGGVRSAGGCRDDRVRRRHKDGCGALGRIGRVHRLLQRGPAGGSGGTHRGGEQLRCHSARSKKASKQRAGIFAEKAAEWRPVLLEVESGAGDESRTRDPGCPEGSTLLGNYRFCRTTRLPTSPRCSSSWPFEPGAQMLPWERPRLAVLGHRLSTPGSQHAADTAKDWR